MKKILSSFDLKIIAIIAMTIDHIGFVFFPEMAFFRIIGRITIPLLTFLIAVSYFHTSNKNKYITRIFIFALISQVPYTLAISNNLNILFNYFFVLLIIRLWELNKDKVLNLGLTAILIPFILISDGSWLILALILAFMLFKDSKLDTIIALIVITILGFIEKSLLINLEWAIISLFMMLSIPFIWLYNGLKGHSLKWLFYVYYPGHLLILYLIKLFLS